MLEYMQGQVLSGVSPVGRLLKASRTWQAMYGNGPGRFTKRIRMIQQMGARTAAALPISDSSIVGAAGTILRSLCARPTVTAIRPTFTSIFSVFVLPDTAVKRKTQSGEGVFYAICYNEQWEYLMSIDS